MHELHRPLGYVLAQADAVDPGQAQDQGFMGPQPGCRRLTGSLEDHRNLGPRRDVHLRPDRPGLGNQPNHPTELLRHGVIDNAVGIGRPPGPNQVRGPVLGQRAP